MDIKLVKTSIRKQMGGNLLTSILSMGRALAPTIGKTLGLSALAGLASEGASQLVKKISGGNVLMDFASELNKRVDNRRRPRSNQLADRILASAYGRQRGGFLITLNAIGELMPCEDLLSTKKAGSSQCYQNRIRFSYKPTQAQIGSGIGTILASILVFH